jgi:hypothetical protein
MGVVIEICIKYPGVRNESKPLMFIRLQYIEPFILAYTSTRHNLHQNQCQSSVLIKLKKTGERKTETHPGGGHFSYNTFWDAPSPMMPLGVVHVGTCCTYFASPLLLYTLLTYT